MRGMTAFLAVKIHLNGAWLNFFGTRTVPRVTIRTVVLIAWHEALDRRVGFDERAIDGELFVTAKPRVDRLLDHRINERAGDAMLIKALTIVCKRRGIEYIFSRILLSNSKYTFKTNMVKCLFLTCLRNGIWQT